MATMHLADVGIDGLGEVLGVHVELEDGEDLTKQLLLMQVVKLKSGVHPINNGVLVDKSGELSHNLGNEASGVAEVVHDMGARNDVVSSIHAVVESSNTIDVVDLMDSNSVRFSVHLRFGTTGLSSFDRLVGINTFLGGLYESKRR